MSQTKVNPNTNLVPGRRYISDAHRLHSVGYRVDESYLNESSWHSNVDEDSFATDTTQVRVWKKQGLGEVEILKKQQEIEQNKHEAAKKRLIKHLNGAETFADMFKKDDNQEQQQPQKKKPSSPVFAAPAPKVNGVFAQPSSSSAVSPKRTRHAQISCSTPKDAANATFRPLRQLNISQVDRDSSKLSNNPGNSFTAPNNQINNDQASLQGTFIVEKNQEENESASLERTHIVEKDPPSQSLSSLEGTHTVEKEAPSQSLSSLEGTHIVEKDPPSQSLSSLEGTHIVEKDPPSLERTLTKEVEHRPETTVVVDGEGTFLVPSNNTIIKESKKSKKVTAEEREKRNFSFSFGDTPSPGSNSFLHRRKQMRPSVSVASKKLLNLDRLSTGSDKERTIAMLSINEVSETELSGLSSSYVDAVSENHHSEIQDSSKSATIVEEPEEIEVDDEPLIRRKMRNSSAVKEVQLDESKMVEKERGADVTKVSIAVATSFEQITPGRTKSLKLPKHGVTIDTQTTPSRHYAQPTISSVMKSVRADTVLAPAITSMRGTPLADRFSQFDKDDESPVETATGSKIAPKSVEMELAPTIEHEQEQQDDDKDCPMAVEDAEDLEDPDEEEEEESVNKNSTSSEGIAQSLGGLSMHDNSDYNDNQSRMASARGNRLLLGTSLATVNTPGISPSIRNKNRRKPQRIAIDDSFESPANVSHDQDDQDDEEEDRPRRSRRTNKKEAEGLVLLKRAILKPDDNPDGLRRSNRTRVKPLRSWLGEKAVYVASPSGGKRLTGVTEVVIKDKRFIRYKTADPKLATERQNRERAYKKERAERRRRELAEQHRRGVNLNTTMDSIVTSDEED